MLRVRFYADDSAPVKWPPKHPFWETGFTLKDDFTVAKCVVVSYADSLEYIYEFWPEAEIDSSTEVEQYIFTSRFERPDWFNPSNSTGLAIGE